MSTVVQRPVAARAVKMTPELITLNAPARPCMNGAPQPRNVSAQLVINTLVAAATSAAEMATAAMESIRNASVKPDSRGVPLAECVFATAPTGAP